MNLNRSLLILVGALFMAGCSSVPTRVDRGPVQGTTFSFMASKAPASAALNERRQAVHQEIQTAITAELGRKGLQPASGRGQVEVGYMVIVADNATTTTYDEYFGFGRDASALSDKAHKAVSKSSSRDRFEIGAIVIDVVSPSDSKVLYRNVAHMDVRDMSSTERIERINMLVASCLGDLRVQP